MFSSSLYFKNFAYYNLDNINILSFLVFNISGPEIETPFLNFLQGTRGANENMYIKEESRSEKDGYGVSVQPRKHALNRSQ